MNNPLLLLLITGAGFQNQNEHRRLEEIEDPSNGSIFASQECAKRRDENLRSLTSFPSGMEITATGTSHSKERLTRE